LSGFTLGVLLALIGVATFTDLRWQKIYNWTTYPGILLGFLLRGLDDGRTGLEDAAWGALGCGGIMLVCLVCFADLGGGDFKLLTMIGAFLGWHHGLEALLWTFVLGGAAGLCWVIWQLGVVEIARRTFRQLATMWRAKGYVPLTDADREPLQRTMFLAPVALAAVVIVMCGGNAG
jgi:prepilin signal peptidase PulO-like enzyme (type II secretory pathway)